MQRLPEHELSDSARRVLDVIWRRGPIARVDIGPLTQLSTMSVTRVTRELDDAGLLTEDVRRDGARGQPARPLMVKADAAYAAGVYFSTGYTQVGLIDFSGALLEQQTLELKNASPADLSSAVGPLVRGFMKKRRIASDRLAGVGFAAPGDFISDRKRLNAHAAFPGFGGEDLRAELQRPLDIPIYLENDAACAALGERLLGVGQTIEDFFFAHVGHGIGGGLVLNGRLYRGAHGNSGLIGVQFPNDRPRPSGHDLLNTLRAADIKVRDFADLETLHPQSCPPLKAWLNRAAAQLREGLWITARMLDPSAIIVGGRLPHRLLQELVVRIDDDTFCNEGVMLPRPRIYASSLGPLAGVIGAAALPLRERFLGVY